MMAANIDSCQVFDNLCSKIGNLHFGRTEGDRNTLSKTLDELNSINYRYTVVTSSTKAALLVNQCCTLIPTDDELLVQKCSQLFWNIVRQQNIAIEGRTLVIAIQWCLTALKIANEKVLLDVLQALNSILRSNITNIHQLVDRVVKELKILLDKSTEVGAPEITVFILQCLEACTVITDDFKSQKVIEVQFELCAETFTYYLLKDLRSIDGLVNCKIIKVCLSGLQNIITQHPSYLDKELGVILGLIKIYMMYGIKGLDWVAPRKLVPSALSIPEITTVREKTGGKLTKQRKQRTLGGHKKEKHTNDLPLENNGSSYIPAATSLEYNSDSGVSGTYLGNRLKTSDSDFSDSESNKTAKIAQMQGRVRQAALNLLLNTVKNTDKSIFFAYWTSFIPEGPISGQHNLVSCILKDPSTRSRLAALNVLLLLLTTSKFYLLQAESSERSTSFTPFSVVLGFMIKELHRGLSLALNEMSVPVLTQVLKCYAALVQATPYHKMTPLLISKVIRNVKPFIYHKDASVQVTALIVLGCVLASEPVIPETKVIMLKDNAKASRMVVTNDSKIDIDTENDDFNFADFSQYEDYDILKNTEVPWLLRRCFNNLGVQINTEEQLPDNECNLRIVAAPVKLESLQVLSAMSRNYFDSLMAPYLGYLTNALDICLSSRHTDLRLHAGRAVDFIGQAINKFNGSADTMDVVSIEHCLQFWQTLLNNSLVDLLQCEQHSILRAVGCDCLGSIGSHIFEQLSRDKQILCITLLFACTRDEENSVKGAAVRALGISVLYPSLREDPGFMLDTAESIHRTLKDDNLLVRMKASWSLGNFSDALVLNSKLEDSNNDIPQEILLKLLQASIKAASDNDKIKVNAVRAIGNLMQLVTDRLIENQVFVRVIEEAFDALMRNGMAGSNMKVRWNGCYALGNAMKNPSLYLTPSHLVAFRKYWQPAVFHCLTDLVIGFKNFKVRINAALALASPPQREHYGNLFQSVWVALLKALENSQNVEGFSEYKHRDHLVEQLCLSLSHLTTLLRIDDLMQLQDTIQPYSDTFKTHVHKALERVIPEKSTPFSAAAFTLAQLSNLRDITSEQSEILRCLANTFNCECL